MLFKEIPGQKRIKERLIKSVSENRVSHAQLFLGPEGSGKLALAVAYAQYINCLDKKADDSCGVCRSCVKYNKLAHPDLHFVFPKIVVKEEDENKRKEGQRKKVTSKDFANEWREMVLESNFFFELNQWYTKLNIENKQGIISADDCNEIIKTLSYKSYEAEYKVMVIWMVEKLYFTAAPKILKILEEPPEKTLFILISENQDQIISTILSRTQLVKIPRLDDKAVRDYLVNKANIPDHDANTIALISEGNLVEALKKRNDAIAEKEYFENFVRWMRSCFSFKVKDINDFVVSVSKMGRERQKAFLLYAMKIARASLLMNLRSESIIKLDNDELKWLEKFYPFINPRNSADFYNTFNEAHYHIERNANPTILFMDVSLKVTKLLRIK